ncbi:hypothetical protein KP509_30G056400 [Ceratopteris richardii]|uniref:Uncharacterized protein n=1 Tax=Ceratopteris richardii TaxID=49495 RepID=A0A8T2R4X8_CERRI|nr:hypothetical protein KP509_30G056400 [Ceratopteris richardii]
MTLWIRRLRLRKPPIPLPPPPRCLRRPPIPLPPPPRYSQKRTRTHVQKDSAADLTVVPCDQQSYAAIPKWVHNSSPQSFPPVHLVYSTSRNPKPSLTSAQPSLHRPPSDRASPIIPSSPKPRQTS